MLLVPLEDLVVFPNMNVTLTVDVPESLRDPRLLLLLLQPLLPLGLLLAAGFLHVRAALAAAGRLPTRRPARGVIKFMPANAPRLDATG